MKNVDGCVAQWRRVRHIYSNTAWLCMSLPRIMSAHVLSLWIAVSLTYDAFEDHQDVCMHKSLYRDGFLSSKWPICDPMWTRRSAYMEGETSVGAAVVRSLSLEGSWPGPERRAFCPAGLSGVTSASLPPRLDKRYVILLLIQRCCTESCSSINQMN